MNKETRSRMIALMDECLRISNETKHHAFFEYYPHVNRFYLQFFKNGWKAGKRAVILEGYVEEIDLEKAYFKLTDLATLPSSAPPIFI